MVVLEEVYTSVYKFIRDASFDPGKGSELSQQLNIRIQRLKDGCPVLMSFYVTFLKSVEELKRVATDKVYTKEWVNKFLSHTSACSSLQSALAMLIAVCETEDKKDEDEVGRLKLRLKGISEILEGGVAQDLIRFTDEKVLSLDTLLSAISGREM